ncbi:MAG: RIO1 family regulatory kinase/ATPase [Candidatus Muiribacteriota bacterium]
MNNNLKNYIKKHFGEINFDEVFFYSSKKNTVLKIDCTVLKFFVFGDYKKEYRIIKKCLDLNIKVPEIINCEKNIITMEYIAEDKNFKPEYKCRKIFNWLKEFHEKTGLLKGDQRVQNYILCDDSIYGMDFEEYSHGDILEDVVDLSVTLLKKFNFKKVDNMIKEYDENLNLKNLEKLIKKNILNRKKWNEDMSKLEGIKW